MNIDEAFPSKHLKADDIGHSRIKLTVSNVAMDEVGAGEEKPVMYFAGKDKGMVLNRTNASEMSGQLGPETGAWQGAEVELFTAATQTPQGQPTRGLRIALLKSPNRGTATAEDLNDDIPF